MERHMRAENGSPGEIRTLVGGSKARYACPLQSAERCSSLHRASPGHSDKHFNLLISLPLDFFTCVINYVDENG